MVLLVCLELFGLRPKMNSSKQLRDQINCYTGGALFDVGQGVKAIRLTNHQMN